VDWWNIDMGAVKSLLNLFDEEKEAKRLQSSVMVFNLATYGGIPESRTIEIYGPEHSGKTYFALNLCWAGLRTFPDAEVLYIDAERTLSTAFLKPYKNTPEISRFQYVQENSAEAVLELIEQKYAGHQIEVTVKGKDGPKKQKKNIPPAKLPIIVIDSIASLCTDKQMEKGMLVQNMEFSFQKLMSLFYKRNLQRINGWLILVNQLRASPNLNAYSKAPTEGTPGGRAIKYHASLRLNITKRKPFSDDSLFAFTLASDKSKISRAFRCFLDVNKDMLLDKWMGCQDLLKDSGLIKIFTNGRYQYKDGKSLFWSEFVKVLDENEAEILETISELQ